MSDAPQFIYVATIGHKSGKPHLIEIWFVERDGRYYIVSEVREKAAWVQNVMHDPNVACYLAGGQNTHFRGTARIVDSAAEPETHAAVVALMVSKYDWGDGLIVELKPE